MFSDVISNTVFQWKAGSGVTEFLKPSAKGALLATERQPISLIVMDVSFISATLVLPAVVECAKLGGGFGETPVLCDPHKGVELV